MRDIMFEIPSNPKIETCIITKETVEKKMEPKLVINENREVKNKMLKKKVVPKKNDQTA